MILPAWAYWIGLVVLTLGLLDGGLRFQRGTRRTGLRFYRDPNLPAVARNGPVVSLYMGIGLAPITIASAPFFLDPTLLTAAPRHVAIALAFTFLGSCFLVGGIPLALAVRPPRRMLPRWLREEDLLTGAIPVRLDWFDWLSLLAAIATVLLGIGLLAGALVAGLIPSLVGWTV